VRGFHHPAAWLMLGSRLALRKHNRNASKTL